MREGLSASSPHESRSSMPAGRTGPELLIARRVAALGAGDLDAVMATYADDALVVMPGAVAQGKAQIRAGLEGMFGLFGGAAPAVKTVTGQGEVWLVTFSVSGPKASVPDGADTFLIRDGLIRAQVVHASVVFAK